MADHVRIILSILFVYLLVLSYANILEIGKCVINRGTIDNDMSFYSGSRSVLATTKVRSLMDCVDHCMVDKICHGSLYIPDNADQFTGKCMLMDYSYDLQEAEDHRGDLMYGKFVGLKAIETVSDPCAGISCATGAICYRLCDLGGDVYPYCIADNSDCDQDEEYTNIRHYFGDRVNDVSNSSVVQHVTYDKRHEDSWIRIIWHTTMRAHCNQAGGCNMWYITFNGSECNDPTYLRRADYSATTGDSHRAAVIDGTCHNIAAGSSLIEIRISQCPGYSVSDGNTGWHGTRQLTVMEIIPRSEPATKPCPGLSVFNFQYKGDWSSSSQHGYGGTVFSHVYKKAAADTNIRIKFQASMRAERHSLDTCGRWAIYIGSSLCSPTADVVFNQNSHGNPSYHRNELKGHTLEGICTGLGVGDHTISIRTIECHYGSTQNPAYFHTGWNSGMRMIMEEVRQSQRLDAVITSDKRILRNPFSNVYQWHAYLWNHGGDNQELMSFTYTKNNDWTGLRFLSSGVHRQLHYPGTSWARCSRWWFQIGDSQIPSSSSECADPGPIEGVYHFNYETNYYHPMQVLGVCMGTSNARYDAGSYRMSYHVGMCYGYTQYSEAYTGWGSSFHIIVEEVAFEETKTCASTYPMNCDN